MLLTFLKTVQSFSYLSSTFRDDEVETQNICANSTLTKRWSYCTYPHYLVTHADTHSLNLTTCTSELEYPSDFDIGNIDTDSHDTCSTLLYD